MSEDCSKYPCSICTEAFSNPRDLGTHILKEHCDDKEDKPVEKKASSGSASPILFNNNNGTSCIIQAHLDPQKSIIMAVDPLEHGDMTEPLPKSGSVSLSNLPREPTTDEQKQKFMIHSLSPSATGLPSSTGSTGSIEQSSAKYICLVCGKAYTSRYNIRCHLNMHSGKNVHSCPYCTRFFAHKHVFDSHLRTHTGERPFSCSRCGRAFSDRSNCSSHQKKCRGTDIVVNNKVETEANAQQQQQQKQDIVKQDDKIESRTDKLNGTAPKFEPQIVSVKSMSELCDPGKTSRTESSIYDAATNTFIKSEEDLEEIQIEPDIAELTPTPTPPPMHQFRPTPVPQHISLPCVPLPKQQLIPIKSTITGTRPDGAMTLLVPIAVGQQGVVSPIQPQQVQQVPPPPSQVFTCSFCNVRFSQQNLLIAHLNDHVQVPNPPTNDDLVQGYMTFLSSGQRNKSMCLSCGKTFTKEPQVKIHLNVHNGDNIYNCRFCEKVFANYAGFEAHVKTHSEEYKFNCKFCNSAFMNRNVMVSHQKVCQLNTEAPTGGQLMIPTSIMASPLTTVATSTPNITLQPPPEKRFKIVLNSDEIKNLILKKDEELRKQEEANQFARARAGLTPEVSPMVTIPSNALSTVGPDIKDEPMDDIADLDTDEMDNDIDTDDDVDDDDDDDEGVDPLEQSLKPLVKPVVRKRAPVFPFEPEDHYVPDNNSNNVINKKEITPPPTAAERVQGYCLRPFRNGQQRYICIVCGKHYTTTYNMRQHRNIHTGRGLHSCRYCGRDFTHKHVWETHERIHTGERPFRCPTCPKDFADRSNYNSHRKLCAMTTKPNVTA